MNYYRFKIITLFALINYTDKLSNISLISGNEQTQASTVQNPDEIALDDDDEDDEDEDEDDDDEQEEEEAGEEEEGEDGIVKQCVPDEVFGKLAEQVNQDEDELQ